MSANVKTVIIAGAAFIVGMYLYTRGYLTFVNPKPTTSAAGQ